MSFNKLYMLHFYISLQILLYNIKLLGVKLCEKIWNLILKEFFEQLKNRWKNDRLKYIFEDIFSPNFSIFNSFTQYYCYWVEYLNERLYHCSRKNEMCRKNIEICLISRSHRCVLWTFRWWWLIELIDLKYFPLSMNWHWSVEWNVYVQIRQFFKFSTIDVST